MFENESFRPLAGISCNDMMTSLMWQAASYRPLAGISCNFRHYKSGKVIWVLPSPCGEKL